MPLRIGIVRSAERISLPLSLLENGGQRLLDLTCGAVAPCGRLHWLHLCILDGGQMLLDPARGPVAPAAA